MEPHPTGRRHAVLRRAQASDVRPLPGVWTEKEAEQIVEESLARYAAPPLTDDEMMRQLKFGGLNEAVTPEKASAKTLDTANDEQARDAALKAVYDESIRQGQPGDFIPIAACLDRLTEYLPAKGGIETVERAWRHVLKDIPEAYLDYREENGQSHVKVRSRSFMNIGDRENDGGADHWAPMADAYVPLTQLGFIVDILAQDGGDMPDAIASLDDALAIPDDADNAEIADAVARYREQHPVLNRLAGAREVYIESEHTTGNSQPSQTVRNVMQAVNEGKRCLLVSREKTVRRVHTTLLKEPKGCHKNHSVDDEQRFYTLTSDVTIEGDAMTRPGSSENVWVHEQNSGDYVLRDDNGTEHARFESTDAIFEDTTAYPMGGDRSVKAPIIPEYDTAMLDIIVVREDATTPADLFLYRPDSEHVPLDMLATDENEDEDTLHLDHDDRSHQENGNEDDDGGEIVDVLR